MKDWILTLILNYAVLLHPADHPEIPFYEVTWEENPANAHLDWVGYRLYWGYQPGVYPYWKNVGTVNRTFIQLTKGKNVPVWYLRVTAINEFGDESHPSEEVSTKGIKGRVITIP